MGLKKKDIMEIADMVSISNELDLRGLCREADELDRIIFKKAQASSMASSMVLSLIQEKYGSWENFKSLSVAKKVTRGAQLILGGAAELGSQLDSIASQYKLPILAWVGAALQIPDAASKLATSISDMSVDLWERLAALIAEKESEAEQPGGQFCINISDLTESDLNKSFMLILSLINPAISSVIREGVDAANNIIKWLPEGSKVKTMLQKQGDAFLTSGLCFGQNSDIPAAANTMSEQIRAASQSEEYDQHVNNAIISEFYIAKNMTDKQQQHLSGQLAEEQGRSRFS